MRRVPRQGAAVDVAVRERLLAAAGGRRNRRTHPPRHASGVAVGVGGVVASRFVVMKLLRFLLLGENVDVFVVGERESEEGLLHGIGITGAGGKPEN